MSLVHSHREIVDKGPECESCGCQSRVVIEFAADASSSRLVVTLPSGWLLDLGSGVQAGPRLVCPECVKNPKRNPGEP